MSCRIIQSKQRIKPLQCFLSGRPFHLLWLVKYDDRVTLSNNINRHLRTKIITPAVHFARSLVICPFFKCSIKRLHIYNHDRESILSCKIIVNLIKVVTIVHKITCLPAILLHEVFFHDLKGLLHALTNSNRRNNHNKLVPAVTLGQLKHSLDIDVGLACTSFHLYIQCTTLVFLN